MSDYRRPITADELIRQYDLNSLKKTKTTIYNQIKDLSSGLQSTNVNLQNFVDATTSDIENLQEQIDGNITTWFYNGVPTLQNAPANEWTTTTDKDNHLGDLYYDQNTGYSYRFAYQNGTYSWTKLTDSDITEALALANAAQDTADSKRRVFVVQPTPPYDVGDIWTNGTDLYRCSVTRASGSFNNADWVLATNYTDDSYARGVEAALNSYKTEVSTTYSTKSELTTATDEINGTVSALTTRTETLEGEIVNKATTEQVAALSIRADGIESTVSTVSTVANNALSTANTANTAATTAGTTANTALSTANTANSTANNALLAANKSIELIVGTQTAQTYNWTGATSYYTSIQDGDSILYFLPYSSSGTSVSYNITNVTAGTTSTNSGAALNLTLADNSTTGNVPLYYRGTDRLTTHYIYGSVIRLTYRSPYVINSSNTQQYSVDKAWIADANYNSDTYDRVKFNQYITAGAAVTAGQLLAKIGTSFKPLTTNLAFDVTQPIVYAGSKINNGSTNNNTYLSYPSVNLRSTVSGVTLTNKQTCYLMGSLSGNTFITKSSDMLTTTIPTTDDGYYYMSLGYMYSTYQMILFPEHPLFKYVDGEFKSLNQVGYDAQVEVKDVSESVDETNQNVADLGSRTGALETDIVNKVDNTDFNDYKDYVVTHYSTINQTDEKISIGIAEATQTLVTKDEYSSTTNQLSEVRSYFDFASDGLTIGKSTSNTTLVLTNEKLSFKLNGQEKAYMSPDSFVLKELKTFKLGGFAFKIRANGNLALVWVGDEE